MNTSKRLQPIANLAKQKERRAARLHGSALREHQKKLQQLDELLGYRNQYTERFQAATQTGLPIEQIRDYQLFLRRLDQAITQQREQITLNEEVCENSQAEFRDKQGRSKMINKVVSNRLKTENKQQEQREQRALEDSVQASY